MSTLVNRALAGLRLHGKGANRTPPTRCPSFQGCRNRAASPPKDFGPGSSRGRMNKPPEERASDVTTVSSAEHTRRDFLYIATGAVGAVGAAAALVPLIAQMNPDASTIAAGAPIDVDLAPDRRRADHQGVLAVKADLHLPSHQERDRRGAEGQRRRPFRIPSPIQLASNRATINGSW